VNWIDRLRAGGLDGPMGLLSGSQIRSRRTEIFPGGTFDEGCLRAAAYDLRVQLASDETPTGIMRDDTLILNKGQRAVLETYDRMAIPWNVAGNIGVKYKLGIMGLFVSPGLFVDPGFGRSRGALSQSGDRLRFLVTNVGDDPLAIRLGKEGDAVLAIQFLAVEESDVKSPIRGVHPSPQGFAFFEDLTKLENRYAAVERTAEGTEKIVVFGVFLIALTIFSVVVGVILEALAAGDAVHGLIRAANQLNPSGPWGVALAVAFLVFVASLAVLTSVFAARLFSRRFRGSS
jgi:deoxycytidine triphosphate deaminase